MCPRARRTRSFKKPCFFVELEKIGIPIVLINAHSHQDNLCSVFSMLHLRAGLLKSAQNVGTIAAVAVFMLYKRYAKIVYWYAANFKKKIVQGEMIDFPIKGHIYKLQCTLQQLLLDQNFLTLVECFRSF